MRESEKVLEVRFFQNLRKGVDMVIEEGLYKKSEFYKIHVNLDLKFGDSSLKDIRFIIL